MGDLNEREAFGHLLNALGNARDAARGLALLRPDQHQAWLLITDKLVQMRDLVEKVMMKRRGQITVKSPNRSGLILPYRQ